MLAAVNGLIADIARRHHSGLGKPEPLKGNLTGWWSRRISGEHRLVYSVEGRRGADQRIIIAQCRFHY
jgi:toxin YoeB